MDQVDGTVLTMAFPVECPSIDLIGDKVIEDLAAVVGWCATIACYRRWQYQDRRFGPARGPRRFRVCAAGVWRRSSTMMPMVDILVSIVPVSEGWSGVRSSTA